MKRLAVIGLGLMGGSLAMAAGRRRIAGQVAAYARRPETREMALSLGAVDIAVDDPAKAVEGSDMVVFCLPVTVIPRVAAECRTAFAPGCVVTDVGSTKEFVMSEMRGVLGGTAATFVGSHPVAGSEETGMEAADAGLYEGAVTIVTPPDPAGQARGPGEAVETVCSMWKALGSKVRKMSAGDHDRLLARTSHLPHLLAALLVDNAFRGGIEGIAAGCGGGFRDATRMAAGSDDIWHDIVRTNADALTAELASISGRAESLRRLIAEGRFDEIRGFLARCRELRRGLYKGNSGKSPLSGEQA